MKVFVSWSGDTSRMIAEIISDWLKRSIQAVKPFYSPEIEKGAKWSNEIDAALEGTSFGLICLTPDNLDSTWIHYETGALSKTTDALIWTFLVGLKQSDVKQPLGRFQHTVAEKEDVFRLLKSINRRLGDVKGEPLPETFLRENFEETWPRLEAKLDEIAKKIAPKQRPDNVKPDQSRPTNDKQDEILEILREMQRTANVPSPKFVSRKGTLVRGSIPKDTEMLDFSKILEQFEQDQKVFHVGEVVEGKVVGMSERGLLVDFGYKSEGIVPAYEIVFPDRYQVGDTLQVKIEEISQGDSPPQLSRA
jgi:hypothetical protein